MKKFRGIFLKNENEIELMAQANGFVSRVLDAIEERIAPGRSTWEYEELANSLCKEYGVRPAFKGYMGYPFALCCSVNEQVVHGFPSKDRILKEGDIVSFDFGVEHEGFVGDSARTFAVGKVSDEATKLMNVTRGSLEKGIEQARSGNQLHDISAAVQEYVEGAGYTVVRRFVGHGIGRKMHEKPEVPNFVPKGVPSIPLKVGMVLAIEPMVTAGTAEVEILPDRWTAVTKDGSLAAHYEHSVAITKSGPRILSVSS